MTDVTLKEFSFSLPSVIKITETGLMPTIDYPHEFFGMSDKEQVSVLNGVLCAIQQHVGKNLELDSSDCYGIKGLEAGSTIVIGLAITLKKTDAMRIECQLVFPLDWTEYSKESNREILQCVSYLLQGSAVTIVRRSERLEISNGR